MASVMTHGFNKIPKYYFYMLMQLLVMIRKLALQLLHLVLIYFSARPTYVSISLPRVAASNKVQGANLLFKT